MKKIIKILGTIILFSVLAVLFTACTDTTPKEEFFTVQYSAGAQGVLEGQSTQRVFKGEDATTVKVVPNRGWVFVEWSDGVTEAERTDKNVTSDLTLTAILEKENFEVRYSVEYGGTLVGESWQSVPWGGEASEVSVILDDGYTWIGWSDGWKFIHRQDKEIKEDINVTALVYKYPSAVYRTNDGKLGGVFYLENTMLSRRIVARSIGDAVFLGWSDGVQTAERYDDLTVEREIDVTALFGYEVNYTVDGNIGGTILGETTQRGVVGELYPWPVRAVPDDGYVFMGWSDLQFEAGRRDTATRKETIVAYFEPIEKTLTYNYGIANGTPTAMQITLNRNTVQNAEFVVPQLEGYTFAGWYADNGYKLKVVNEDGLYMLGYYGFTLETDVLYARWKKNGEEEERTNKLLIVIVDSIQDSLYSKKADTEIEVDYKMSAIERKICSLLPERMDEVLNEWFQGVTNFEVDAYWTTQTVSGNMIYNYRNENYSIYAYSLPEIFPLLYDYHNILTVYGMNDYDGLLHNHSGSGGNNYGYICLDSNIGFVKNGFHYSLDTYYRRLKAEQRYDSIFSTCLHVLVLAVESLEYGSSYEAIRGEMGQELFEDIRKYLLRETVINGQIVGVPLEYWKHEMDVSVNYDTQRENYEPCGKVVRLDGEASEKNLWTYGVYEEVKYGGEITVEAIPFEGYRFVGWSDGVTTAIRHDKNIISFMRVKAIFEKI